MTPTWFQQFTQAPCSNHATKIDDADVHYQRWSASSLNNGKPGLLFVHGYGAHSHWWDFIAPAFVDEYDVVAMDMTGAGDSNHRDIYKPTTFTREIRAVCNDANLSSPIIVGHSFGGSMTRLTAYLYPQTLTGVILVDSPLTRHRGRRMPPKTPTPRRRYYPSLSEAAKRFRLRPAQPCNNKFIVDHIAMHSLGKADKGYYFKLDQSLFSKMQEEPELDLPAGITMIEEISCPVGFIYGKNSRFFPADSVETLQEIIDPELLVCIGDAHHHVFLDQPLEFITSLRKVLTSIRHLPANSSQPTSQ